jgi:pimeloyl-ACP methyl ester carboxylesterase
MFIARKLRLPIFSLTLLFALSTCSCIEGSDRRSFDYTKTPVLFVHGHGMSASSWNAMISYLMRSSYPGYYLKAIELHPNNGSNIIAAEKQITSTVEDFLNSINSFLRQKSISIPLKTKVDLISHSMGAMSARWYAAKIRPDRVRMWLSLGGSNHGTDVLCRYPGPGANDLCPAYAENREESLIQFELNGQPHFPDVDETPFGIGKDSPDVDSLPPVRIRRILYISIRTSPEKWIKPETSPILDGAGGLKILIPKHIQAKETSPGNFLMTNRVGHDAMLSDRNSMELVKTILSMADQGL